MNKRKAFTLIEILIVIAIIGILASAITISLNFAKKRAINAQKTTQMKQLYLALATFNADSGRMPLNYNPGSGACEGDGAFEKSMQELVDEGLISSIPKSPGSPYCYYDYDVGGGKRVALLATTLNNIWGVAGPTDSCRPVTDPLNWCNRVRDSAGYCLCYDY